MGVLAASLCGAWVCALAQTSSTLKESTVYNRPVYLLSNDKLEVAVVKVGGSLLRLLIQGDSLGLSPFGNPEMVPQVPDNRKLQGPMVGHFVCVDGFGSPSPEERAAGLDMHGEAYLQPWKLVATEKQGATATTWFLMFYVRSPAGMSRVDDVRLENGKIIVEDRAFGKTLTVAASLPF